MNYYKKFINKIFIEWRYQTENGVPNIANPLHEAKLRNILKEKKLDSKVINQIIKSVAEKLDKIYVDKERDAPRGAKVKTGPEGGTYYIPDPSQKDPSKPSKDTTDKQTDTTPADDVLNTKNFTKTEDGRLGSIEVNLGGTGVKFLFGKNVKKFRERLYSLLRGGGNQTLRNEAKNIR